MCLLPDNHYISFKSGCLIKKGSVYKVFERPFNLRAFRPGNKTKQRSPIRILKTLEHHVDAEVYLASALAESFFSL